MHFPKFIYYFCRHFCCVFFLFQITAKIYVGFLFTWVSLLSLLKLKYFILLKDILFFNCFKNYLVHHKKKMELKHKWCQNRNKRRNCPTFWSTSLVKAYIPFEEVTPIWIMENKKMQITSVIRCFEK